MNAIDRIAEVGLVPVIEIPTVDVAVPLARALVEAGIPCLEITFRTAAGADSIAAVRDAFPDIVVGAGTILTLAQVDLALQRGAQFVVSPGFSRGIVDRCQDNGVPVIPGVCTPTEIQLAIEAGLSTVKFFPAEAAGGVRYLRALAGPFWGVDFIPTGGIDAGNLAAYLALPRVVACGGSWFVRREWLVKDDFRSVTESAAEAAAIVRGIRG